MRYRVVKFKEEHFNTFDVRDEQRADLECLLAHPEWKRLWEGSLPMFTLFADDKPIMIYGMAASGIGTYFPQAFVGKGIYKHVRAVVRCMYDYVEKFVGDDVRRLEAAVAVDDKQAQRFVEFFGFEPIGYRRQATIEGKDQILYERLGRK